MKVAKLTERLKLWEDEHGPVSLHNTDRGDDDEQDDIHAGSGSNGSGESESDSGSGSDSSDSESDDDSKPRASMAPQSATMSKPPTQNADVHQAMLHADTKSPKETKEQNVAVRPVLSNVSSPTTTSHIEDTVAVPVRWVGCVIGPNGQRIREIERETMTRLSFDACHADGRPQECRMWVVRLASEQPRTFSTSYSVMRRLTQKNAA